jgi:hypothetical protein
VSDSDLIEVVERNGEFRKWGRFWGPLLYWRSLNAARPRSFWWGGLVVTGATAAIALLQKYGGLLLLLPAWLG